MVTTTVSRSLRAATVGAVLFGGALSASVLSGSLPAGATTTVELYVAKGGAGSACTEASPCRHISKALEVALTETGDSVVISVAGGTYNEIDAVDASSLQSLSLQGAGASSTIVNGGGNGKVLAISAGTVSLSGFTIEKGLASGKHRGKGLECRVADRERHRFLFRPLAVRGGSDLQQGLAHVERHDLQCRQCIFRVWGNREHGNVVRQ